MKSKTIDVKFIGPWLTKTIIIVYNISSKRHLFDGTHLCQHGHSWLFCALYHLRTLIMICCPLRKYLVLSWVCFKSFKTLDEAVYRNKSITEWVVFNQLQMRISPLVASMPVLCEPPRIIACLPISLLDLSSFLV